ncbi:uncharacterized protein LOC129235252 [Uloborus diversus]|uniref:uncharacterized protein LOC129235252 n=1 Tax=Uloborus diversus TaxID=327109 RepID=UPI0024093781|nr:uncharacterized protein LOC129235252 [Uloborus diversus]
MDVNSVNVLNHDSGNGLVSSKQLCHPGNCCVDESPGDSVKEGNLLDGKSISEIPPVSSEQLCHSDNHLTGDSHVDSATEGNLSDGKSMTEIPLVSSARRYYSDNPRIDDSLFDNETEGNSLDGKSMSDIPLVSSELLCHSEDYCVDESQVDKATNGALLEGTLFSGTSETNINLNYSEKLETCKQDTVCFNDVDLCTFNNCKRDVEQLDKIQFSDSERGEVFTSKQLSRINDDIKYNDRTEKRTCFPKTIFPKNIKCKNSEDATNIEADEDELDVQEFSERSESIEEKNECDKASPKLKTMISIEITEDISTSSLAESESKNDSLKSSLHVFDEDRPMISRSTSLKTGKTPPGTPRKKIVRFADVLGLDLEDVRHIMCSDLPNIPSSAYTDLVLSDDDKPTPTNEVVVLQNTQNDSAFKSAAGFNSLYPMFSVPGLMSDFKERVHAQGICLESVTVSDLSIQCTCRVMNWGYKKRVVARYTVNDWASSNDIDASYIAGSTQDDSDAFSFNIFLSPFHKNVKFALRYQVNGKEYWDNNRGDNYCFGYYSDGRSSPSTSTTWVHQFW